MYIFSRTDILTFTCYLKVWFTTKQNSFTDNSTATKSNLARRPKQIEGSSFEITAEDEGILAFRGWNKTRLPLDCRRTKLFLLSLLFLVYQSNLSLDALSNLNVDVFPQVGVEQSFLFLCPFVLDNRCITKSWVFVTWFKPHQDKYCS